LAQDYRPFHYFRSIQAFLQKGLGQEWSKTDGCLETSKKYFAEKSPALFLVPTY